MLGADNLGAQLVTVHTKKKKTILDFLNVIHNEADVMDC